MTRTGGDWLEAAPTQAVMAAFEEAGHQIFLVGGCVRNALLGVEVSDIDLATSAHPDTSIEIAETHGWKAIGTGLDHGTVTLVVDGTPHEVTTFRADRETDGRHAVVQFSDDARQDAHRRDFTMNGLFADREGQVHDWVDGIADIAARRVRFIGAPDIRIREDYLRILRFFRFHAWYGDPASGIDPEGLAACAAAQEGLERLSAERVGAEMKKLLAAADPAPAIAAMSQAGILAWVLPGSDDRALAPLVHLEAGRSPGWVRRAAVLGGESPTDAWRLSKHEARALEVRRTEISTTASVSELGYRHGAEAAIDIALCRAATFEQHPVESFEADATRGASAEFPIKAADLAEEGPALGVRLKDLEAAWIASDFTLTRDELLA